MSDHPKEQGIVSLERLLSYHKRSVTLINNNHRNHFPTRERSTAKPESTLPEDIIRTLWALLSEGYFKQIKQDDFDLLSSLISLDSDHQGPFHEDEDFQTVMQETFRPQYLQKKTEGNIQEQLHQNWLEEMYILWNCASDDSEESLKGYQQFERKREGLRTGSLMEIAMREKELFESVNIGKEFRLPAENELVQLKESNENIIESILAEIHANSNKSNLSKDSQNSLSKEVGFDDFLPSSSIPRREHQRKTLLRYFQYQIQNLQRKQVAECMTKVQSKRKTQLGNIYQILFQEAMGLGSIQIGEQQLTSLNKLRETSLFQFYQAGWKSRLNYICHDYQGFQSLLLSQKTEKTEHNDKYQSQQSLLSQLTLHQEGSSQSAHLFSTMQACHECKLLYDKRVLSKCTFLAPQTSPTSPDLNFPSFYDPYLYFLLKHPTIAEYVSGIWNDSILVNTYSSRSPHQTCGRYFCKMCIKGQSASKCRFCQGVCNCSRCIRNNTIIRLKTLYAILGGDIRLLERDSYFARICPRPTPIPKETPEGGQEMIVSYKMQLEELRLLAHSVMRREMIKEEHFANEEAIVREKLRLIDRQ